MLNSLKYPTPRQFFAGTLLAGSLAIAFTGCSSDQSAEAPNIPQQTSAPLPQETLTPESLPIPTHAPGERPSERLDIRKTMYYNNASAPFPKVVTVPQLINSKFDHRPSYLEFRVDTGQFSATVKAQCAYRGRLLIDEYMDIDSNEPQVRFIKKDRSESCEPVGGKFAIGRQDWNALVSEMHLSTPKIKGEPYPYVVKQVNR